MPRPASLPSLACALSGVLFMVGCFQPTQNESEAKPLATAAATAAPTLGVYWTSQGTNASDVGAGAGKVFITTKDKKLMIKTGVGVWKATSGQGTMVDVDWAGWPWIVGTDKQIWEGALRTDNTIGWWTAHPGIYAADVGVGKCSNDWGISAIDNIEAPGWAGNHYAYNWVNGAWKQDGYAAVKTETGPNCSTWRVQLTGQLIEGVLDPATNKTAWYFHNETIPGGQTVKATDIGIGANGAVWITSYASVNSAGDKAIYRYRAGSTPGSGSWELAQGEGVRISVDDQGNPWVVKASGEVLSGIAF